MRGKSDFKLRNDFTSTIRRLAETEVPYPWLYFAEILPLDRYSEGAVHPVNYCYRIDNRFAVTLQMERDHLTPGQLNKWDYRYHYEPVSDFGNLMELGTALEAIRVRIARREFREIERLFWEYFEGLITEQEEVEGILEAEGELLLVDYLFRHYALGPFHSCALYMPFSAEWREPYYFFRLHDSFYEV